MRFICLGDQANGWNLTAAEWANLVAGAGRSLDILEDGAFVRVGKSPDGGTELRFYASALNKPDGWRYGFTESLPRIARPVASIGRAWHHAATGFVEFEVKIDAAAQSLVADYEGGAGDFDDATFEQEVDRALKGTPGDRGWLVREFDWLTRMAAG